MEIEKSKVQAMIYKNIKLDGLTHDCLDEILEPALKELVADTSTPFDDILMDSVYDKLEAKLKEYSTKYYAKLLGQ